MDYVYDFLYSSKIQSMKTLAVNPLHEYEKYYHAKDHSKEVRALRELYNNPTTVREKSDADRKDKEGDDLSMEVEQSTTDGTSKDNSQKLKEDSTNKKVDTPRGAKGKDNQETEGRHDKETDGRHDKETEGGHDQEWEARHDQEWEARYDQETEGSRNQMFKDFVQFR